MVVVSDLNFLRSNKELVKMASFVGGFVFILMALHVTASKLELTSDPAVLIPPLTRDLTLRCGLTDTLAPTNALSDVCQQHKDTPYNVVHVTSIIISRGTRDYVALITQQDPAKALLDTDQLSVKGNVNGTAGDQAYLELKWTDPGVNQSSNYTCEVNALDRMGHNVIFSGDVEIRTPRPDQKEIILSFYKALQSEKIELEEILAQFQTAQLQLQKAVNNLAKPHAERGTQSCGNSNGWTLASAGAKFKKVQVNFAVPYDEAPVVSVALSHIDVGNFANTRINMVLKNVSKTGFEAHCVTWADTRIFGATFDWFSLGV